MIEYFANGAVIIMGTTFMVGLLWGLVMGIGSILDPYRPTKGALIFTGSSLLFIGLSILIGYILELL